MMTLLTSEETRILELVQNPLMAGLNSLPQPNIVVEKRCPNEMAANLLNNLRKRLDHYKVVVAEYLHEVKGGRSLEYSNLLSRIDKALEKVEEIDIEAQPFLSFGQYSAEDDKIHLYVEAIRNYALVSGSVSEYLLGIVFVREYFNAIVNHTLEEASRDCVREIEEAMAECYMLNYFKKQGELSNDPVFLEIYALAEQISREKKHGLTASSGFGYYLHRYGEKNHSKSPEDICQEYYQKAHTIDHDSINIISYCLEVMLDYPNESNVPQEAEKSLFGLLIHQILNVGQNQELKFIDIFNNTKAELKQSLLEIWQPKGILFTKDYQTQIEGIIERMVSENILVENMSPWQSATPVYKQGFDYTSLIDSRLLEFLPYEHQVKCWESLLSPNTPYKSMVITTGTGSGKTESFMVPIITELSRLNTPGLKAIFLYPLNALMEDQKRKLNDIIERSGSNLHFAVYNGASPEGRRDPQTAATAFSHELLYREEIRGGQWDFNRNVWTGGGQVPDIILTNPTMLEYMLLRRSDRSIINGSQSQLSWIVIDETHSYTGAGADELAMLLRRVLKAFRCKPDDVHFATSSATVGDSDEALLKFISGITGQGRDSLPEGPIKIVKGQRSLPDFSLARPANGYSKPKLLTQLIQHNYVYLKDLIPYEDTPERRLMELDRLCSGGLKVKVHFFVEALTKGLYANLEDIMNGANAYQLKPQIPLDELTYKYDSRYMEIMHCAKCGEILASAIIDTNGSYSRALFGDSQYTQFISLYNPRTSNPNVSAGDILPGNQLLINRGTGRVLISNDCSCPICGASNSGGESNILPFNVSSAFTMRCITPVLLNSATPHGEDHPYNGRQFISFADSRRGAAEPSLEQNLENESKWVIGVMLKLLHNTSSFTYISSELTRDFQSATQQGNTQKATRILQDLQELNNANIVGDRQRIEQVARRNGISGVISWDSILEALYSDVNCPRLAACFAREGDWDPARGTLSDVYLKQYVLAALYNTMKSRSKFGFSPESYGLFQVVYKDLERLTSVPDSVRRLNDALNNRQQEKISVEDWKDFLKIYLDFHVRTNENLFFKSNANGWSTLDINDCRNLRTQFGKRRSVKDPLLTEGVHYKLLWRLFGCENKQQIDALDPNLSTMIDDVIRSMREELTQNLGILETGQTYRKPYGQQHYNWVDDKLTNRESTVEHRTNKRLNIDKLSFALSDTVFREENAKCILDTTFKGHTPYQDDFCNNPVLPISISNWIIPYPIDAHGLSAFYAQNHVDYLFCSKVRDIFAQRPIFIQYEHTAQVGRELTKARIRDFKEHDINVLACSTTMEMGVDIGELEIVSMSNVPPHPANYKQRVGRAGRAFQNKSASLTICNSDAVGLSVLNSPINNLVDRTPNPPSADLNSPQVVQRHINSYLLRKYLVDGNIPQVFANRSIKNYALIDFFFDDKYDFDPSRLSHPGRTWRNLIDINNPGNRVFPNTYTSSFHDNSLYKGFIAWLLIITPNTNQDIWEDLDLLKSGTALNNEPNAVLIAHTKDAIEELFAVLTQELTKIQKLSTGLDAAGNVILDTHGNPLVNWANNPISGYTARLHYDFIGLLMENLMIYCSTHQFTPNANMPVNIVKLKINYDDDLYANPSRDLVVALSEYSPGKSVVIDGKSFKIAGVDWDRTKGIQRIHICRSCGYTWEDSMSSQCPSCGGNLVNHHDMIEPTAFLPEQETDRIIDKGVSSVRVLSRLIGANGIQVKALSPLCDFDVEYPNPRTKILYLNAGSNYGYCICTKYNCGRAAIETKMAEAGDGNYLRNLMYTRRESNQANQPPTYEHQNLSTWEQDYFDSSDLMRNVLIGGSISTNYSILKPYHSLSGSRRAFSVGADDSAILVTLGLLVCEELSKIVPCQRQDIDFLLVTIGQGGRALCIYDTAKGGAGYSSALDKIGWSRMLDTCRIRINEIINKKQPYESLFSRSTLKYLDDIDLLGTFSWLTEEYFSRKPIPPQVSAFNPQAVRATIGDIERELDRSFAATLFVQGDINTWNYELPNGSVPSWKDMRSRFRLSGGNKVELAFCGDPGLIPVQAVDIIKHSQDWAVFALGQNIGPLFPLAYVNGTLFFTDDCLTANYNGLWGSGAIYAANTAKPGVRPFTPMLSGYSEFYISKNTQLLSPANLLNLLIQRDNSGKITDFITNAQGHDFEIVYTDEHLKTQLGIIISIQLIDALIRSLCCRSFSVKYVNEKYFDYYGKSVDDPTRNLMDSMRSSDDSNQMINQLLIGHGWNYSIDTNKERALPHWRSLIIKDKSSGGTLTLKPHGGLANGWYIDTAVAQSHHHYYGSHNTGADTDIPIISSKDNDILYTVGLQ